MSLSPSSGNPLIPDPAGAQQYGGVYPAKVYSIADPSSLGRIQMFIPQVFGEIPVKIWAPSCISGGLVPAVGTIVWCIFQGGDPSYPTYLPTIPQPVYGATDRAWINMTPLTNGWTSGLAQCTVIGIKPGTGLSAGSGQHGINYNTACFVLPAEASSVARHAVRRACDVVPPHGSDSGGDRRVGVSQRPQWCVRHPVRLAQWSLFRSRRELTCAMADRSLGSAPYMPVMPQPNQQKLSSGDVYYEAGPTYSSQEALVTASLATATIPADVIRAIRPPLPQIDPFPPRFGYPDYPDRQPGIQMAFTVDRYYPNARYELSGGVAGAQSSARNVGVEDVW